MQSSFQSLLKLWLPIKIGFSTHPIRYSLVGFFGLFLLWFSIPPQRPFENDYSQVIVDRSGKILHIYLASDEQWRFPLTQDSIPKKYLQALFTYEDKRFLTHKGIDFHALARAAFGHLKGNHHAGGASTLTMQIVRLSHPQSRNLWHKTFEILQAIRYELHWSKTELLRFYIAHAPMGSNVIGVETACQKYCNKKFSKITWADAALFAILPNSPSWIHLNRKRPELLEKRNRLLRKLAKEKKLDEMSLELAIAEPLPDSGSIPHYALHFCEKIRRDQSHDFRVSTTLDLEIQKKIESQIEYPMTGLKNQGINNLAILVVETETGKIRGYLGSPNVNDEKHQGQVDGVLARRSTGSLLKPFLYGKLLDRGPYLITTKLVDIPTYYGSFAPQNASKEFSGFTSMDEALIRSLNVPAVRALNEYGLEDFYTFLKKSGLRGLFRSPDGYGLPLILGGAEANLWELTDLYVGLGRNGIRIPLSQVEREEKTKSQTKEKTNSKTNSSNSLDTLFSAGAATQIREILTRLQRPEADEYWQYFNNQVPVAWKTGTSFGQKDGWAIGTNAQWTIGVWVGNFSGEGNSALGGAASAAPILFQLFNELSDRNQPMVIPDASWDLISDSTCASSGFIAGPFCPIKLKTLRPKSAYVTKMCPLHRHYLIDKKTGYETCSRCWQNKDTTWVVREIYPASLRAWLTQSGRNPDNAPIHDPLCPALHKEAALEIIYPPSGTRLFVPRDVDGTFEQVVFEAADNRQDAILYWYLDGKFLGQTHGSHKMSLELVAGAHHISIEDEVGHSTGLRFEAFRR